MADPFPADALDANRAGRLTAEQRTWLRGLAKGSRGTSMSIAGVAAVLAVILIFFADRGGTERLLFIAGLLVVAGFFFVRGFLGADSLDADLREGYVESVEGAIAKRTVTTSGRTSSTTTHWIDVERKRMRAFKDQYDAAPDAGYVRVYYVPHSMRVVNLERLPDHAVPEGEIKSPQDILKLAASGLVGFDEVKKAEARAEMAALGNAMAPKIEHGLTPPAASARDPRPLAEAIVGRWTSGVLTVTFNADGTATAAGAIGPGRSGRWSVDTQGRLALDVLGEGDAAEAWVVGDELTITHAGEGMTFERA
jgi:hypothetical protein